MSKVLITGGCGFIGSHLSERLLDLGNEVTVLDKYNSFNSLGWLEDSKYRKDINFVLGDIRDYDIVSKTSKGQDSIYHLAALIGIPYSYISPLAYIRTNIEGTYNVLESAKVNQIENILVTSTSETYGSAQYVPINESHPKVGQSPYAASKIAADQLSISYNASFDLGVKIARPFNTYGPRQSSRAIIPSIISQLLLNKKQISLGNLKPTRDLTFVSDTVNGLIEVMQSSDTSGLEINIGMSNEISIEDLVKKISKLLNVDVDVLEDSKRTRPESSEVDRLFCDNSLLKSLTDWQPEYNLESGLIEVIDFMQGLSIESLEKQSDYLI